ncbi:hypothetical protein CMV_016479 [Castanea mollissima]|uniref:Uncharacterized protein n=1 Tax=Castanea mollissima TaxID=60419 RepID=A0A8J4VRR0_9ROSI|nr:hypothetical protein CMV_016479 [Castanea mollissima]
MLCIPSQLYKWSGLADWTRDIEEQIIPLCRTTKIKNLENNIDSLKVKLTEEDLKEISDAVRIQRKSQLNFKSKGSEHDFGKNRDLGKPVWAGNSLTIEVIAEGKRRVAWHKAGLRSSLSVSREQREPCGSRANICSEVDLDKDGSLVGLHSEPNGPSRLEVSVSPPRRNLGTVSLKDQVLAKSKATYEASEAQEAIGVDFAPAEESPELSEKVASVRQPAPTTATSSATQTETSSGPATASVADGGSFSDGSLAGASPAELDRAEMGFLHTMRPDLVAVSSSEHLGCPAETMAGAMSLFSGGPSAVESLLTLGIAETEGERPFKGLELSTSVLSPPRVGIEANQSVLALSEVETAYAVEALGEAESSSPLMSINPLGVIVAAELIKNTE